MAKKSVKNNNIGKTKRSTDDLINEAIAQQNSWMENRRTFAKRFLKTLNIFARPAPVVKADSAVVAPDATAMQNDDLSAYWFPIFCALLVVFAAVWVAFSYSRVSPRVIVKSATEPEIVVVKQEQNIVPAFDLVRIESAGTIVVAGRWQAKQNVSILINKNIVATVATDSNGDFAYAPTTVLTPGNYTFSLIGADENIKSTENVFVYISEYGYENSVSLLMTADGSTLLQAPATLRDGDLAISKIDYLDSGRVVVTGDALPRLRVSLALNEKYLGFAKVSDHRHFGLGADVGELQSGQQYTLTVRMHDGDGRTVSQVGHTFVMPEMTGDDDTFYTVRNGDCLWIIARNFMRRGILFSIIANRNDIENPDLIYPNQILEIPVGGK